MPPRSKRMEVGEEILVLTFIFLRETKNVLAETSAATGVLISPDNEKIKVAGSEQNC